MGDASFDPRERVGLTLNEKWTLLALLGSGGTAAIYAASHRNGRTAAVKVLHAELARDPDQVARFLQEGYIANQVDHPGVVQVVDDDVSEAGLVYLVIELLVGTSLDQAVNRHGGVLPAEEALAVADGVLDVLSTAHERGIVHRDIKPENVFLVEGGGIKVLDFGIAKSRRSLPGIKATQIGAVFGTPGFMPPEQARGRAELIDARADVWAVGAMLLFLLTGQRLHEASTANESLLRAMTEAVPPVRSFAPSVPRAVAEVLDRALSFDLGARWPNASVMRAALLGARGLGPSLSAPPPRPRTPWPILAAAWVGVATMAAGAVIFVARRPVQTPAAGIVAVSETPAPAAEPLEIELPDDAPDPPAAPPQGKPARAADSTGRSAAGGRPPRITREDALRERR